MLQYLLEQRDHVVSKDELCTHVWPDQFISDATLEGCITLARRAIGDSGRGQRLIQSRRGYGYRFVGTVEADTVRLSQHEAAATAQGLPTALPQASGLPVPGLPVQSVPEGERKLVTILSRTSVAPWCRPRTVRRRWI